MNRVSELAFVFVEVIPQPIPPGTLCISTKYATAIHLCACGCGQEVVTPLSRADWTLLFNGTVSLDPSIGNWSFACQSHYWVTDNHIVWAPKWSRERIDSNRRIDGRRRQQHDGRVEPPFQSSSGGAEKQVKGSLLARWLKRLLE